MMNNQIINFMNTLADERVSSDAFPASNLTRATSYLTAHADVVESVLPKCRMVLSSTCILYTPYILASDVTLLSELHDQKPFNARGTYAVSEKVLE